MKTLKEWVSRQLEASSLLSSVRPLTFIDRESASDESNIREQASSSPSDALVASHPRDVSEVLPREITGSEARSRHDHIFHNPSNPLSKVELLQIKFLRLALRLGIPLGNSMLQQVLYRLHLAKVIRSSDSDPEKSSLDLGEARAIATEMESIDQSDLDFFSFKILLLGKTGVGKSATINSIFNQKKAETSAFEPSTSKIAEISETIRGIKITAIDTPGFRPSSSQSNQRHNRRLMLSIKRFIRRSPPDVILYVDRVDFSSADILLLKLVSDVIGSSIWFNAVMVFTHSSRSQDAILNHCSSSIQSCINEAISDARFEIPVMSVENDSSSWSADSPPWLPELALLCGSMKVLSEANSLLRFENSIKVGRQARRAPSLPHLLSSLLQRRSNEDGDNEDDGDDDDGDDHLPPFRALSRVQFEKLTQSQKKAYLEELDYRETILLKKQLREERRRRHSGATEEVEEPEATVAVDMVVPASFDQECVSHRYRFLSLDSHWVVRPVLDSHGWDHDVGFDGVNVEVSDVDIHGGTVKAFVAGQLSKDKNNCNLAAEGGVNWEALKWCNVSGDVDLQAAGKESALTLKAAAAVSARKNSLGCGLSLTGSPSTGEVHALGVKVEDLVLVGRRFRVSVNGGVVNSLKGRVASGAGMEMTFLGKDFPVREDRATVGLTLLSYDRELVVGGALKSEFRIGRRTRMGADASLNSRQMGRVSLKMTTSAGDLEVVVFMVLPLLRSLLCRRLPSSDGATAT